ncbi:MAG TPA: hypothetical protein VN153_02095 [Tahibacter sp.]|nr:hypothetical protein [Tahibacter sp.]
MNEHEGSGPHDAAGDGEPQSLIARLRRSGHFDEVPYWGTDDRGDPPLFAIVDVTRRLSIAADAAAFRTTLMQLVPAALKPTPPVLFIGADRPAAENDAVELLLRGLHGALNSAAFKHEIDPSPDVSAPGRVIRDTVVALEELLRRASPMSNRSLLSYRVPLPVPGASAVFGETLLVIRLSRSPGEDRLANLIETTREAMTLLGLSNGVVVLATPQRCDLTTLTVKPGSRDERIALLCGPTKSRRRSGAANPAGSPVRRPEPFWSTLDRLFRAVIRWRFRYDTRHTNTFARMQDLVDLACRPSCERVGQVRRAFEAFADSAWRHAQSETDPTPETPRPAQAAPQDAASPREIDWTKLRELTDTAPEVQARVDEWMEGEIDRETDSPRPCAAESPKRHCTIPLADAALLRSELKDAAKQAWTAAAFLKILEVVFPDLLREVRNHEEGEYRLYLFLSLAANPGSGQPAALKTPRWQAFLADDHLMTCCRFAFAPYGRNGERLVTPFTSAGALKQHLSGLLHPGKDKPGESWNRRVLELNRIVTDVIESTTSETRAFRNHVFQAKRNTEELTRRLWQQAIAAGKAGAPRSDGEDCAELLSTARRVAMNHRLDIRAQQEIYAREREGTPIRLYEWLYAAERFVRSEIRASCAAPYEYNDHAHRYLAVLEIWCVGTQTTRSWSMIQKAIGYCITLLRRAADLSQGAVTFEAFLGLARAHTFALIAFSRAEDTQKAQQENVSKLETAQDDHEKAIATEKNAFDVATERAGAAEKAAEAAQRAADAAQKNAAVARMEAAARETQTRRGEADQAPQGQDAESLRAKAEREEQAALEQRRAAGAATLTAREQRQTADKHATRLKELKQCAQLLATHKPHTKRMLAFSEKALARVLPQRPHHQRAREDALANATRLARDHLDLQLAVQLTANLYDECNGHWTDAETEYLRIQKAADAAGHIEIAARAGYSAMRARAAGQSGRAARTVLGAGLPAAVCGAFAVHVQPRPRDVHQLPARYPTLGPAGMPRVRGKRHGENLGRLRKHHRR